MSKFSKENFFRIIKEIEIMETAQENFAVPLGILEIMYDDYSGYLDYYFHQTKNNRSIEWLWKKLN